MLLTLMGEGGQSMCYQLRHMAKRVAILVLMINPFLACSISTTHLCLPLFTPFNYPPYSPSLQSPSFLHYIPTHLTTSTLLDTPSHLPLTQTASNDSQLVSTPFKSLANNISSQTNLSRSARTIKLAPRCTSKKGQTPYLNYYP